MKFVVVVLVMHEAYAILFLTPAMPAIPGRASLKDK